MTGKSIDENEAWYRNHWVWLIIAIPALTVIGCMFTIYLAITNPDFVVRDAPAQTESAEASRE